MNKYNYTIEDIEKVRGEIKRIIEDNKDKIPKYDEFPRIPRTECFLYETNPNGIMYPSIRPATPSYLVRTNYARRGGYIIDDSCLKIVKLQDIDGDFLDYIYDIRLLDFKPIHPNCNLDRLMKYTEGMLNKIKNSFSQDEEDDMIRALRGDRSWVYRHKK